MTPLKDLEARSVTAVNEVSDGLVLEFGRGFRLSIINAFALSGGLENGNLGSLKGQILKSTKETEKKIELSFPDGNKIVVSLEDEAFRGPEAMILERQFKPLVVWN